jgi:hypothetical protein
MGASSMEIVASVLSFIMAAYTYANRAKAMESTLGGREWTLLDLLRPKAFKTREVNRNRPDAVLRGRRGVWAAIIGLTAFGLYFLLAFIVEIVVAG